MPPIEDQAGEAEAKTGDATAADPKPEAEAAGPAVRAKLTVTGIADSDGGGKIVKLEAVYDESIPEDKRFSDATPYGQVELLVNNPAAVDKFVEGRRIYVDFTPA